MKSLALVFLFLTAGVHASSLCQKLDAQPKFLRALSVVATNMHYSMDELCSSERILDVQITNSLLTSKEGREEAHVWVTLHYNEYSCQYFVRDADLLVTKKNCYNTW